MSEFAKARESSYFISSMKSAFEFGHRCGEKGMNIQAALAHFDLTLKTPIRKQADLAAAQKKERK